jgi:deoxyribonuclease V
MSVWPRSRNELVAVQRDLADRQPEPWVPPLDDMSFGGCFVCFEPGLDEERTWAAASLVRPGREAVSAVIEGQAPAPYESSFLALREGPILEAAVRTLPDPPDVLLVNATGRDHPRRAGLALHLGAVLGLPTVGVTDRTLLAEGPMPARPEGSSTPLRLDGSLVGAWLRTRDGVRPVAVHAAWRTDPAVAIGVVRRAPGRMRTPGPIRLARQAARRARASALRDA